MREELFHTLAQDDPLTAARRLIGCCLLVGPCRAEIVEVEAYTGAEDPGSHAHRGPTPRNQVMFGPPGRLYMYFTYGNHWMANVVCRPEGAPGALLIRACRPLEGHQAMRANRPRANSERDLLSGPGKLTQAMALNGAHYGTNLFDSDSIVRIEPGPPVSDLLKGPRIGLRPGHGDDKLWRFVWADRLDWASRPLPPGAR
ncbi:MAG: DNA-3-methyladenine glycosylase [Fimbriimonadaceae bacterium]|nr:DNA-3-methyladenine glycosylase [Fimbriimonadaceae bacterium]QYK58587.1 MAG: DNA-3-methyladenine glycosylase [Fimbriimonadaceae bacterium]